MARPVVAGSDGSQESLQAVEWAAAEAARHSVPLRIVTVAAPSCPADEEDPAAMLDELMHAVYAQSLRTAARELARTVPGLIVETELLDGPPGRMLAHDSSTAQLLVVGAYGVGGYRQPGLGREARYLAMHAHCPVVVARDQGGTVHDEIVVGVRDLDDGAGAIPFAFEEAALRGGGELGRGRLAAGPGSGRVARKVPGRRRQLYGRGRAAGPRPGRLRRAGRPYGARPARQS
jgi:nucleotide-binding universal stress UspA family protein